MMGKIRRLGAAVMLGIAAAIVPMNAHAGLAGDVSVIRPVEESAQGTYIEMGAGYNLLGADAFTFLDLKQDGAGYFGKTSVVENVVDNAGIRVQAIHGNEPVSMAGIGVIAKMPGMPDGIWIKAYAMPLWLDNEGDVIKGMKVFGFSAGANLPYGIGASVFGELNEDGEWKYGEGCLEKDIGPVKFSYNPALNSDGDAIPEVQHRIRIKRNF